MLTGLLIVLAAAAPAACEVREASMLIPQPVRPPCVAFRRARTMTGIWMDMFEGQAFFAGAKSVADIRPTGEGVWLMMTLPVMKRLPRQVGSGHAYGIRFRGREAQDMHRKPLDGYGHFNGAAGLVIVDRTISLEDLGCVAQFNGQPACLERPAPR